MGRKTFSGHEIGLEKLIVDVRAFSSLKEIQYSVFGNRYVQLQKACR